MYSKGNWLRVCIDTYFKDSFPLQFTLYSESVLFISFTHGSMLLLIPYSQFILPTPLAAFPFGNHKFVFYVCESVSIL